MFEFVLGYTAGQRTATRAASLARDAAVADGTRHTHRIEDLAERVDELALILRGMWALIEEGGVTAEQLMSKLEELDLADGVADGKVRRGPVDCPGCDSKIPSDLSKCQYCGTEVVRDEHPLGHL
jgi:predicted HAD superfamily Cof-like phosphohydrolase